jgi:hypothetical protein
MILICSQEGGMIHSVRLTADDVEVLMTRTRVPPVLVTGATGRVGRAVVHLLLGPDLSLADSVLAMAGPVAVSGPN